MRRLLILFFLCLISVKPCISQGADELKILRTYYVSSTEGDDTNDGKTEQAPVKHISSISQKEYVCLKLKCGDVFFEQLQGFGGSIIESYGEGDRPVLCGYKVILNPQNWFYDEKYACWKMDLRSNQGFGGMLKGDVSENLINNIGFIYNPSADRVYGHMVRSVDELKNEGDFFVASTVWGMLSKNNYRYIFWKTKDNPKLIKNLCVPMALVGVKRMFSCTIRDIAVTGFCFGFTNCHHSFIDNVQIDLIGGAIHTGASKWVRYGNGIEFWGNTKNCTVTNSLISRTYDSGVTIQGNGNFSTSPENIHFKNNKFYHCRQAFEYWLNPDNDFMAVFKNCSFTDNLCVYMGENEFSSPEERDANILTYDLKSKDIVIENNVFWGAPLFYGTQYSKGINNNEVVLFEGQYIVANYNKSIAPLVGYGKRDIKSFKRLYADNSSIKILKYGSKDIHRKETKIMEKLAWKSIDLHLERLNKQQ